MPGRKTVRVVKGYAEMNKSLKEIKEFKPQVDCLPKQSMLLHNLACGFLLKGGKDVLSTR